MRDEVTGIRKLVNFVGRL